MHCLTKLHTPIRDDILLLFAAYCFSSCSIPKWVIHSRSPLGCPCSRVSLSLLASPWPGMPAQLSGARTSFACGQASPWWQGSQAGPYGCRLSQTAGPPLLSLSLPPHTQTWLPVPAPVVRWPLNPDLPCQQQQEKWVAGRCGLCVPSAPTPAAAEGACHAPVLRLSPYVIFEQASASHSHFIQCQKRS